jgi:hypothetical protein
MWDFIPLYLAKTGNPFQCLDMEHNIYRTDSGIYEFPKDDPDTWLKETPLDPKYPIFVFNASHVFLCAYKDACLMVKSMVPKKWLVEPWAPRDINKE